MGIVLVAMAEHGPRTEGGLHFDRVALGCTVLTVLGFGAALSLLDVAAGDSGLVTSIWSAVMLRYGSLAFIIISVLVSRTTIVVPDRSAIAPIAGIGVFEMISNALFAVGAAYGSLVVIAVTSSMYPLTTAALARFVLGERLSTHQFVGAACTFGGAVLLSVPS